jgi:2-dehydropantoate 2-reductase
LLLNLNNPVNALSGLPLKAQLSQRAYRRCLALLMAEAQGVLNAAGIRPAKVAKVGPAWLPHLLRLPDAVFSRLAAAMLSMDEQARSSMWEDLQAGRRTEVDYLNGAVVALAESLGRDAPANRRVVALVRAAEAAPGQALSGPALWQALAVGA